MNTEVRAVFAKRRPEWVPTLRDLKVTTVRCSPTAQRQLQSRAVGDRDTGCVRQSILTYTDCLRHDQERARECGIDRKAPVE